MHRSKGYSTLSRIGLLALLLIFVGGAFTTISAQPINFVLQWGTFGSGDGQFNNPEGVAVVGSGNVYVADTHNHRIQKFDSSGTFLTKWGTFGSGEGQFRNSKSVAVDGSGHVYVADEINERIQKFLDEAAVPAVPGLARWGLIGLAALFAVVLLATLTLRRNRPVVS